MWITAFILSAILVIIINNWVSLNVIIHRYRFPELGPEATINKLLDDLGAYLTWDGDVRCDACDGIVEGLKVKMIKHILKHEDIKP